MSVAAPGGHRWHYLCVVFVAVLDGEMFLNDLLRLINHQPTERGDTLVTVGDTWNTATLW